MQCLEINFDFDSIKKKFTPSSDTPTGDKVSQGSQLSARTPSPTDYPSWMQDSRIGDSSRGYQLKQLCYCFYTAVPSRSGNGGGGGGNGNGGSTTESAPTSPVTPGSPGEGGQMMPGPKLPVFLNQIQYSVVVGM